MTSDKALTIGMHAAQALLAAKNGDATAAARHAIDAALEAVPRAEAQRLLDQAAIDRANAFADTLESAKYGPEGP